MKTKINRTLISCVRSFGAGVLFTAGIAFTALLAQTATAWTNGETLTATKLNQVVTDLNALTAVARASGGNLGVGTTSPTARLEATTGSTSDGTAEVARFYNSSAAGNSGQLRISAARDAGSVAPRKVTLQVTDGVTPNDLLLNPGGGRVGIGMSAPNAPLHVKSPGTNTSVIHVENSANTNNLFRVVQSTSNAGTVIVNDAAGNQDIVLNAAGNSYIDSGSYFGIGHTGPSSMLDVRDTTLGDGGLVARFGDDTGNPFAIMRFNLGGDTDRMGIGITQQGTINYIWADNSGNLRILAAGGGTPGSQTAGTVIGTQTSTRETKQDIEPYATTDTLLQSVLSVPLYTFKYKHEAKGYKEQAKRHVGFMADEVDPRFLDGFGKAIDQVSVNGILIGATQEQQKHIRALQTKTERVAQENADLRRSLAAANARLARIETLLASRGMTVPAESPAARSDTESKPRELVADPGLLRQLWSMVW